MLIKASGHGGEDYFVHVKRNLGTMKKDKRIINVVLYKSASSHNIMYRSLGKTRMIRLSTTRNTKDFFVGIKGFATRGLVNEYFCSDRITANFILNSILVTPQVPCKIKIKTFETVIIVITCC